MKDKRYYIGETTDIEQRLSFHNNGRQRSTMHRIPFQLILFEELENRTQALRREKQIKSWKGGNSFKKLIQGW